MRVVIFCEIFMSYIDISDRNYICFLYKFMGMEGIIKNWIAVGYGRNWLSHFIYFNEKKVIEKPN